MSVFNKTIRELEEAAVEAQLAMNWVADQLEAAGMADIAQLLRLRAVALDLAGSACARERACADAGELAPETVAAVRAASLGQYEEVFGSEAVALAPQEHIDGHREQLAGQGPNALRHALDKMLAPRGSGTTWAETRNPRTARMATSRWNNERAER